MTLEKQQNIITKLEKKASDIRIKKSSDYANEDVLSNFKLAGNICGLSPEQNCLSLIATKVARLGNLLKKDKVVKNEPVKDSILDLINYGYLLYCLLEDEKGIDGCKVDLEYIEEVGDVLGSIGNAGEVNSIEKPIHPIIRKDPGYVVVFSNGKGRYVIEETRLDLGYDGYRGRKVHTNYKDCEKECNYLNDTL